MNINCRNTPEARDGYFTTYYSFNKIVLDVITEKFDIQVDENTRNQAALLHNDIPGYDLPTINFIQTDNDEDISILEEDNLQIYAYLDNVLVHMIDNQQTAIFKSNQDFIKNKEKISQYIKYAENWQVASVMCSYPAMACDVLLIVAMIVFLLKYHKTMKAMLTAFLQMNIKNTSIQSVQADQIGRTYPLLFTLNLPKEEEIVDDLREITAMEYVVQVIMIIVCIAIVLIVMYFCCTNADILVLYVMPPQSWGDRSGTKHSKCLLLGGRWLNRLTVIPKPKGSGGARAATAQIGPANKRNDTKRCLPIELSLRPGEAVPW